MRRVVRGTADRYVQKLVLHDMVALFDHFSPKFVKRYANSREITGKALLDFRGDMKNDKFPKAEPGFTIKEDEYLNLLQHLPKP